MLRITRALLALATTALIAVPTAAGAGPDAVQARASLAVTPDIGAPTTPVTIDGAGFKKGETVDVAFDSIPLASVPTGRTGAFTVDAAVPAVQTPGAHSLKATGQTSGRAATARFRVSAAWSQFGFDAAHTGFNPYEVLLGPSNANLLQQAWKRKIGGAITTSPITSDQAVFVGTENGTLAALKQRTGKVLWSVRLDGEPTTLAAAHGFDPQPDPPGKVFVGTQPASNTGADGSVSAFLALKRGVLWSVPVTGGVTGLAVVKGFDPQPDPPGKLFAATDAGLLYALSTHDGSTLCSARLDGPAAGPPTAVRGFDTRQDGPGRILVLTTVGTLYLIASHDCKVLSSLPGLGAPRHSRGIQQGLVERAAAVGDVDLDGTMEIAVGSEDGNIYMIDQVNERLVLRWSFQTGGAIAGTPAIGTLRGFPDPWLSVGTEGGDIYCIGEVNEQPVPIWVTHVGPAAMASPGVANGVIINWFQDGRIRAFDAADGSVLFRSAVFKVGASSPIVSDGFVIFGSSKGLVYGYGVPDM